MKGKHTESPKLRRVRYLDSAIKTITRIRNEIDPHYIPPYPTKPQSKLSLWFERIFFMIDWVMWHMFLVLMSIIGVVVAWAMISALIDKIRG